MRNTKKLDTTMKEDVVEKHIRYLTNGKNGKLKKIVILTKLDMGLFTLGTKNMYLNSLLKKGTY